MTAKGVVLRRVALTLQAVGVVGSTLALLVRWVEWGGLRMEEVGDLLGLLLLFWSPYVALAAATRYLGRGRARLMLLVVASLLVAAWDAYWRIRSLLPDPDTVAELIAPVLITGNQWIAVVVTLVVVALVPAPQPPGAG